MSVSSVKQVISNAIADKTITAEEMKEIQESAGKKVSENEFEAIENFVETTSADIFNNNSEIDFKTEALESFMTFRNDYESAVQSYEGHKALVDGRSNRLDMEASKLLDPAIATESFGGTAIPAAVKEAVTRALAAGAEAYDVSELEEPKQYLDGDTAEEDYENQSFKVSGKFSPYPQDIEAHGSMSFDNTEITPQKLEDDMNTVQTYTQLSGYEQKEYTDWRTGEVTTYTEPQYETITSKGTGNVAAHYDEDSHSDKYARGRSGQKWANNYTILADGSLHALPAMRRTEQENLILTNPSLARGKKMLFNGHIEIRGGVVVGLGMSGRIQKLAVKGDHKFVDPLPILEAWGFEIAPGLRTQMEGSHGEPERDEVNGTIG